MHLIHDPWLTVRKSDASRHRIRPCDVVNLEIVDVDAPRADLVVAARTFLIGLMTTAGLADSESDWQRLYHDPPTADTISAALARFAPAFELLGNGHRFCQYQAVIEDGDWQRIASLLIDGPSEESDERNHDVMIDVVGLSPSTAALALYALQQFAPSGGRGHRQSMRGGSPMSTLVSGGRTLWQNVWLNVETNEQLAARSPRQWQHPPTIEDVFPWMGHVRTSEIQLETTTSDAHPLQVYWQMPRLLWLEAGDAGDDRCGLTGESSNSLVRGYYRRQRGVKYSADWRHPHVPYVREHTGVVPARASARASHVGDWLGIVYRDQYGNREPASVVTTASTHRVWSITDASLRVDVFGFDMRSRKVLGAISHVMPIIKVDPGGADEDLRAAVERCVLAVELVAQTVEKIALAALAGRETKDTERRIAKSEAKNVMTAFLTTMERHVEAAIRTAAVQIQAGYFDPLAQARTLHRDIRREVEAAFDARLPTDTWVRGLERRVRKRLELSRFLSGLGKSGAELFATLQLPTPKAKREAGNAT